MADMFKNTGDPILASDWNRLVEMATPMNEQGGDFTNTQNGTLYSQPTYRHTSGKKLPNNQFLDAKVVVGPTLEERPYVFSSDPTDRTKQWMVYIGPSIDNARQSLMHNGYKCNFIGFYNAICAEYQDLDELMQPWDFDRSDPSVSADFAEAGWLPKNDGWAYTGIQRELSTQMDDLYCTFANMYLSTEEGSLSGLSGDQTVACLNDGGLDNLSALSVAILDQMALCSLTVCGNLIKFQDAVLIASDKGSANTQYAHGKIYGSSTVGKEPWDLEGGYFRRAYYQLGTSNGECPNASAFVMDWSSASAVYCVADLENLSCAVANRPLNDVVHSSIKICQYISGDIEYCNRSPVFPIWSSYSV